MEKQYKILSLHAENVKKIKVVDITTDPANNTVVISGANGNGKSSVLDCIEMAFRGADAIPDMPIRRGEDKAVIEIDLGDLKIRRTFTEKSSYIFVETAEGARFPNPQTMLDKMLGLISFDPLEFTRIKPKDQYESLRKLVPMKVDIDAIDKRIKGYEDERTHAGRMVKELTAQVAGIVVPEGTPETPVDVSALSAKIVAAKENYARYKMLGGVLTDKEARIQRIIEEKKNLDYEMSQIHDEIRAHSKEREEIVATTPKLEEFKVLETELANASTINAAVAKRTERASREEALKGWEKQHAALETSIKLGRQEKSDAIAEAKMPVKGLSLEDGQVFYKDVPLSQASTAEQIRVSTAIAMASNPSLRVIRIKDASLLDDESMEIIRDMAKKHDFQVWLEVVNSDDPMAVVIEDGEVAQPKAVKKKARA